jgi:twinkle protein
MKAVEGQEYERAVLGHCLRFPEKVAFIIDGLREDDFSPKCRAIYSAIKSLHVKKTPVNHLTVSTQMRSDGAEMPASELIELEEFSIDGQETYDRDQLKIRSTKRKLQSFLSESIKEIPSLEYSELDKISRGVSEILSDGKPFESDFIKSSSVFFEQIKNFFDHPEASRAIATGWEKLDKLLGGLRPNELTELTGETGSGKTTWAANLGYRLSKNGHPVLIASFEMKPLSIIKKMLQMESGRPLSLHTLQSVSPFYVRISSFPIFFLDQYGEISLSQLKQAIFYARRRLKIEFAILDHLHFFLKFSGDHERQAIDQALRDLKSWAMELGIHILLIVHPTKIESENRPIRLNDLKGSSGLKQVADNVISIWRPRDKDDLKRPKAEIVLDVLKVRDDEGDEGKIILTFDKRSQSYSDSGPDLARSVEGERSPASSPSSRSPQGREWQSGYDS